MIMSASLDDSRHH